MSTNGCIIPGTPIAVDFWRVTGLNAADFVFFLTHLHGDHIVGLTSTWRYPIYCSEFTAELLATQRGVERSLLHPLEVGSSHLVPVPSIDGQSSYIAVSVINANHCPGSVMFLFEGPFGKILHTGDFRYKPDLIENSILNDHKCSIDVIYLDNTFCSPECTFPTQHVARQTILDIIRQHRDCDIVLGMRKLGKENLLAWLALSLKEWISVPGEMYSRIQTLELPNVFRINDKTARIRVEPFHLVTKKMLKRWNENKKTVVILPTAIYTGIGGTPYTNQKDFFVVPYSDHSSYSELLEFVSKLKPCAVVPIVSSKTRGPFGVDISSRADMSCFDRYCRTTTDGVIFRQALRMTGKPSNILLPVHSADGKRKTLKRKRSVGNRKVYKGVEYLLEGENLERETSQHNSSDESMKAKVSCVDSVANKETNLCNNSYDERMKHKVVCKCSVASLNKTNLKKCYHERINQKNCCDYSSDNSDERLKEQTSFYAVTNSRVGKLQDICSDETVEEKIICNHSDGSNLQNSICGEIVKDITSTKGDNLQENCSDQIMEEKSHCSCSVPILHTKNHSWLDKMKEETSSTYSVTILNAQNHQDSCLDCNVKERISPDRSMELNCSYSVTNTSKVRKPSDCRVTNLNSLTATSYDISKDKIRLKTDSYAVKENANMPATNCNCSYNHKHISSLPLALPDCADIKQHMVDLCGNGLITKQTNRCCSHNSCLGQLTFKVSNEKLFSKCSMVMDTYSVKSLSQTNADHSTKNLVLALEKWLSDT